MPHAIVSSGSGRGFRDMNRNKNTTTDVGKIQIRAGFALGIRHGVLGDLSGTAIVGRDNSHGVDMRLRTAPTAPVFLRDVAFGTDVPKQAPTKKSAHHTPDATSLGCNHLGGRLTRPHAAGITQIGPQTARLPQFGVGVGGALLTCLP